MDGCIYRTKDGECDLYAEGGKFKAFCDAEHCDNIAPTNADCIRAMTDEDLAKFIEFVSSGCDYMFPDCPAHDSCKLVCDQMDACRKGWLDWLKQEAAE